MEAVLANGDADLVSMARPFLADPEIVNKAASGDVASINTCIGCNQACLDHTFKVAMCIVIFCGRCFLARLFIFSTRELLSTVRFFFKSCMPS